MAFRRRKDALDRLAGLSELCEREFAQPPSQGIEAAHLARITAAARDAHADVGSTSGAAMPPRPFFRRRLAHAATVGVAAVIALPLTMSGLAIAGVGLPGSAVDAFDALGISLPNQDRDEDVVETPTGPGAAEGAPGKSVNSLIAACESEPRSSGDFGACVADQAKSFGQCVRANVMADVKRPAAACNELRPGDSQPERSLEEQRQPDVAAGKPKGTPGGKPDDVPSGKPKGTPGGKPDDVPSGMPGGKPERPPAPGGSAGGSGLSGDVGPGSQPPAAGNAQGRAFDVNNQTQEATDA